MKILTSVRGIHYERPESMRNFLMKNIIKPLMQQFDFFSCDRPTNCSVSKYSTYSQLRMKIKDKDKGLFSLIFNQAVEANVDFRFLEYRDHSNFAGMSAQRQELDQQLLTKIKNNELSKHDLLDLINPFLKKEISMIQERDNDIADNFLKTLELIRKEKLCIFYGALHNWDRKIFQQFGNSNRFALYFMMPDYSKNEYGLYINNALISRIILSKSNFEEGLSDLTNTLFLTDLLSDVFRLCDKSIQKKLIYNLRDRAYKHSDFSIYPGDLILYSVMNEYFGDFFDYFRERIGKEIPFEEFEEQMQSIDKGSLFEISEIMKNKFCLALKYLKENTDFNEHKNIYLSRF